MMLLIAFLNAAQDLQSVFNRRLLYQNRLETPLQCRIPLNILTIVIKGSGTNTLKFTPCQRRLKDISRINGTLSGTGTDHGVEFINKEDTIATGFYLLNNLLQPFFKLAPVLCSGNYSGHIKGYYPFPLQCLRNITLDNAVGQALNNSCFAHSGLTDERRIVLGPAAEYLDYPFNLSKAADNGVKFARPGSSG